MGALSILGTCPHVEQACPMSHCGRTSGRGFCVRGRLLVTHGAPCVGPHPGAPCHLTRGGRATVVQGARTRARSFPLKRSPHSPRTAHSPCTVHLSSWRRIVMLGSCAWTVPAILAAAVCHPQQLSDSTSPSSTRSFRCRRPCTHGWDLCGASANNPCDC